MLDRNMTGLQAKQLRELRKQFDMARIQSCQKITIKFGRLAAAEQTSPDASQIRAALSGCRVTVRPNRAGMLLLRLTFRDMENLTRRITSRHLRGGETDGDNQACCGSSRSERRVFYSRSLLMVRAAMRRNFHDCFKATHAPIISALQSQDGQSTLTAPRTQRPVTTAAFRRMVTWGSRRSQQSR